MWRSRVPALVALLGCIILLPALMVAQVRVTPKQAKGGAKQGELWEVVPESFQYLRDMPQWPVPSDLKQWHERDRQKTRETLFELLGELPPRPDPGRVKVLSREDKGDHFLERFEFHNGVDMVVPGMIVIPKNRQGRVPAIIGMHGHGTATSGGKERICSDPASTQLVGPMLAKRGYVVAAIDACFNGDRLGKGPAGLRDDKRAQEWSLFKLYLLQGQTLWGMMLRDQQCLIDYVQSRAEVDKDRIGATGMSMGCTTGWWLAAIDERIKALVGVACFTRYAESIALGTMRLQGIFPFVPGLMTHFDTEAIYSLIAPRPMLMLSGDQDGGAPTAGIIMIEEKVGAVYGLYGSADKFRSVIYKDTGHEYLPEMKEEMAAWFERHLPVGK